MEDIGKMISGLDHGPHTQQMLYHFHFRLVKFIRCLMSEHTCSRDCDVCVDALPSLQIKVFWRVQPVECLAVENESGLHLHHMRLTDMFLSGLTNDHCRSRRQIG